MPEPWFIAPEELRLQLRDELRRELAPGHPLHDEVLVAVAKCGGCDDAVFSVEGRFVRWARVHLTWSRQEERPPFPRTTIHATLRESVAGHEH
jgi:hypothetical protein